jgi:uncharacterized protein (DUF58 family)
MMQRLCDWTRAHINLLVLAGLTLITYLAAINRVQALPWGIAALLSATLIAGVVWPHWLVRRLSVVRSGPERAEEGEIITFHVEVENRGWLPRFMVELVDRLPFVGAASGAVSHEDKVLGVIAYVPGSGRRRFEMPLRCEKRGFYQLGPVGLVSSFPLGLVEVKQRRNEGVQTLTIYPDVFTIVSLPLRGAPSQIHRGGYQLPEGSGAAEFSGLREYRRGDNPRHIHWPTTARLNELMVKEFEPLASACLHIVLDLDAAANVGWGRHASFEYALRIAGSIARYATLNNLRVRMSGEGARPLAIPAGSGELQYQAILDELAVADSDGALPYPYVLNRVAMQCLPGETVVIFLSGPPERDDDLLQALALLRARRTHLFAVLFDHASFEAETLKVSRGGTARAAVLHGGLLDLGAHCVPVRNGDDLVRLFNP